MRRLLKLMARLLWTIQCMFATWFGGQYFIWYLTTPRGLIPFYCDTLVSFIFIGLVVDWFIAIFA